MPNFFMEKHSPQKFHLFFMLGILLRIKFAFFAKKPLHL